MKQVRVLLQSFALLGLVALAQMSRAQELPPELLAFINQQHRMIAQQGQQALQTMNLDVIADFEAERIAFIESCGQDILHQGETAVASLLQEMRVLDSPANLAELQPVESNTIAWATPITHPPDSPEQR